MPGPKPKPTNMKVLEGNPGKRSLPLNEPQPAPIMPECPSFIFGAARKEWKRLAPELHQLGLLTRLDRAAMAAYCIAWGQLEEVEHSLTRLKNTSKELAKLRKKNPGMRAQVSNGLVSITSNGNVIIEPLLSVRKQALEQMHKFLVEFGMTPASRSRIVVEKYGGKDPMDDLLNAGRNN